MSSSRLTFLCKLPLVHFTYKSGLDWSESLNYFPSCFSLGLQPSFQVVWSLPEQLSFPGHSTKEPSRQFQPPSRILPPLWRSKFKFTYPFSCVFCYFKLFWSLLVPEYIDEFKLIDSDPALIGKILSFVGLQLLFTRVQVWDFWLCNIIGATNRKGPIIRPQVWEW